jgi:hypothetical protein
MDKHQARGRQVGGRHRRRDNRSSTRLPRTMLVPRGRRRRRPRREAAAAFEDWSTSPGGAASAYDWLTGWRARGGAGALEARNVGKPTAVALAVPSSSTTCASSRGGALPGGRRKRVCAITEADHAASKRRRLDRPGTTADDGDLKIGPRWPPTIPSSSSLRSRRPDHDPPRQTGGPNSPAVFNVITGDSEPWAQNGAPPR